MKRLWPLLIALSVVGLSFLRLSAQQQVFTRGTAAELALARSIGLEQVRTIALQKGINGPNDLVVSATHVDQLSMAHTRVQQYFRSVPVLGGQAIAHMAPDGTVLNETDNLLAGISVDTTPRLTPDAAIDIAVADYGCRDCLTAAPRADLWILRHEGIDRLGYRVQLTRLDGTSDTALPVRFVDAHGGSIELAYDNLQTGTGSSLYSGNVAIGTSFNGGAMLYVMENLVRRVGTFDIRNFSGGTVFRIIDPDDIWNTPAQRAGVDAHYGAERYLEYLQTVHGRNGIDGMGGPVWAAAHNGSGGLLTSIIHFGSNYNNAFWDGLLMVYGDGDGVTFSPLVALDITGHEMTHGVTEFTAGLLYTGESGALNESWSDVMGAMLERRVRGETPAIWMLAEQAFTPGVSGDALRFMNEPHRASNSGLTGDDDPDHYSERYTGSLDNGGVHVNSGIANKAFHLLAAGGTHHMGGSMTGIGADDASRIWFNALTSYMTPTTDFAGARAATIQAAMALFGAGSAQVAGVENAWCLVGVGGCHMVDAISVTPNSGTGLSQTFTMLYSDSAGVTADLNAAQVRFASTNIAAHSCTVHYRATTDRVRIQDDAGTWGPWVPFGGGTIGNSQCALDLALSGATASGTNLTLTLHLTFAASFSGPKNIYMRAASAGNGETGWPLRGTWRVGAAVNAISAAPDSGTGLTQTFAFTYSDAAGVTTDLQAAQVRIAAANTATGSCTIHYRATIGMVRMQDNAGNWSPWRAFGSGTLVNSQCALDLAQSSAIPSGTNLTVTLRLTFTLSFAGMKNVYMRAASATGTDTGWVSRGTWDVGAAVSAMHDILTVTANASCTDQKRSTANYRACSSPSAQANSRSWSLGYVAFRYVFTVSHGFTSALGSVTVIRSSSRPG